MLRVAKIHTFFFNANAGKANRCGFTGLKKKSFDSLAIAILHAVY